jgi:phage gp29-like protein
LEFCNSEISKAILTQTLTTEIQGKGTYSAAQVHGSQLEKLTNADKRLVEKTINTLFRWINEINFRKPKHPKFALYREEEVDKALAERDVNLKQIGVKFKKNYFENNYNLKEDEFELVEQTDIPTPPAFPKKKDEKQEFSEAINKFPDQQSIDEFTEILLSENSELAQSLSKMIQPVIDLVEQSESLEQIKDKLSDKYPEMNSKQFEKALKKVLFIADNFGRLSVEEESK